MFERESRRGSLRVWMASLGLVGLIVISYGWKAGWFPLELADANTGILVEPEALGDPVEPDAPLPAIESGDSESTAGIEVPEFLSLQDEPSAELASTSQPSSTPSTGPIQQLGHNPAAGQAEIRQVQAERADDPSPPQPVAQLDPEFLRRIDAFIEDGQDIAAHRELSTLYWKRPEVRDQIQTRIEKTAYAIYLAPQPFYLKPYEVQPGDQLRLIAIKYDVPWEYLAKLNRVDPQKIRPGQKLKVNRGPFSAVVDLSDYRLTVHCRGYFVHSYKVGVGKDGSTPIGRFRVQEKLTNPTYYGPDGVIAADNPSNPLGEHWIGIGNSYGIHGTIEPESIGKSESRGCVRMHAESIAEVYELLSVDSDVVIRR